ncbi:MAG: pseudouridine synthase [Flavobacteriaceae bacterium]|nr:pseudouridine synthase [Psychroflexus sp.]
MLHNSISEPENHKYFKIYKPDGYLSQFIYNQKKRQKKKLLGELGDFPEATMAVGRLDEPSEGLLLLTTDGKASYRITSTGLEKEYHVQVDGLITDAAMRELQNGVEISIYGKPYQTKPCQVERLSLPENLPKRNKKIRDERHGPTSWIRVIITEGKYRQVRKMTAKINFPTLRLVRYRIDDITIVDLQKGEVKEISSFRQ